MAYMYYLFVSFPLPKIRNETHSLPENKIHTMLNTQVDYKSECKTF